MCGICGLLSSGSVNHDSLKKMADELCHRGPDDEGFYVDGGVGLANRRLSIIDLEAGSQPICNEDESVWITYNGEIYNYIELRKDLIKQGHRFKTRTDTEVIVHLYEEYGTECVNRLRGMFAFAIWDKTKKSLFLARDPLGQKQLYYTNSPGLFTFASEIKSILVNQHIRPKLNVNAMDKLISIRCVPGQETLFEGIYKIPAGHIMTVGKDGLKLSCYWDLKYSPKLDCNENEVVSLLKDLLFDTVSSHMNSDVPIGCFLSGGIDSSLITAIMCSISEKPVKTFSIGVSNDDFSELPFAKMVSDRYSTDHHELVVEPEYISELPQMIRHMEEPIDPFAYGVNFVSRLASEHVKVVLGGDGGDEIFAGYDRYYGNVVADLYCLLPGFLRKNLIKPLIYALQDSYGYNNYIQKFRWLDSMSDYSGAERYAQSMCFLRFSHIHKRALYTDKVFGELSNFDPSAGLLDFFNATNAKHPVDKMLYTDYKSRLSEHALPVLDKMTMANSIEGRSPYVDQRVAEFAASIPANLKLKRSHLKYIQRQVAKEFLPQTIIKRSKIGFGFPLAHWFKNKLYNLTLNMFNNSNLVEEGYFKKEEMNNILDEHRRGKIDHNYRIWMLLNLEIWHRMFIEGKSVDNLKENIISQSYH